MNPSTENTKMREHTKKPEVQEALETLLGERDPVVPGMFLADQTGMGKTILMPFVLSWMIENQCNKNKKENKPTLISCPAMLVESWAGDARRMFPNIKIGVMYAGAKDFSDPTLASRIITTQFTKALPSMKKCPDWLRPAFEWDSERCNPWVIIAAHDTFMSRTLRVIPDPSKANVKYAHVTKTGDIEVREKPATMYQSTMAGMFSFTVLNEGHKFKNHLTKCWASIRLLESPRLVNVSATPMISSVSDPTTLRTGPANTPPDG